MRKLLLLWLLPLFSFAPKAEKPTRLSGYFVMLCYISSHKCPCGLSIARTNQITGDDSVNCLCDGAYYKNVSIIYFVKKGDLDESKIDDFSYFSKLAPKEIQMFLSTDAAILQDAWKKDSLLIKDTTLIKQVQGNTTTAELFQAQIDQSKFDFTKKRYCRILIKGEVTALRLKNRTKSKSHGLNEKQYLFLNDPNNHLEFVKIIKGL
jgi:hypothetical protein